MVAERNAKLNQLQRTLPEGLLVDSAWLAAEGFSRALKDKYLRSGWLEAVAHGVYRRPLANQLTSSGEPIAWERVVLSLQNLLNCPVHVGGRTALELHGFAHYLPARGKHPVHLYTSLSAPGGRLPRWLHALNTNADWVVHNRDPLFGVSAAVSEDIGFAAMPWGHWRWPLTLSTPERALFELLDELPNHESFDQVDALFGGLATLSPRRLQRLLETCQSVKVKRLFFVFAERHAHRWLKQLNRDRINLGVGKRVLTRGGKLHPKYQITVPAALLQVGDDL